MKNRPSLPKIEVNREKIKSVVNATMTPSPKRLPHSGRMQASRNSPKAVSSFSNTTGFSFMKKSQSSTPNPFLMKLSKISSPATESEKDLGVLHEVTVRMISNYGNGTKISCSKIDILDRNHLPIKLKTAYIPPYKNTYNKVSRLFEGQVVKDDEIWEWPWPQPNGFFEVKIEILSKTKPEFIRIWPNIKAQDANIKEIGIFYDDAPVYRGIVDDKQGRILPLSRQSCEQEIRLAPFSASIDVIRRSDALGVLPIQIVESLAIKILGTYNQSLKFCIQLVKLYDFNGNPINIIDNSRVRTEGCGESCCPDVIFQETSQSYTGNFTSSSKIIIEFIKPIPIAAVELFNVYNHTPGLNMGISRASIWTDENMRWVGKVQMRSCINGLQIKNPQLIPFTDNKELLETIRRNSQNSA